MPAKKKRQKRQPNWGLPGIAFGDYGLAVVLHHQMTQPEIAQRLRRLAWKMDQFEKEATPEGPANIFDEAELATIFDDDAN